MAADFININRTKQLGNGLVRLAELVVETADLCDKLSAAKDHSINGGDYSVMETNFGLETGAGANAATLIGYINEILNSNTDVTGVNRLARLREFTARLAGQ